MQDEIAAAEKRKEQEKAVREMQEENDELEEYMDRLINLSNKANDLIRAEKWLDAFAACEKLKNEFPSEIDGDHRLSEYYEARGDYAAARKYAKIVLDATESNPEKYHTDLMETFFDKVEHLNRCVEAGKFVD